MTTLTDLEQHADIEAASNDPTGEPYAAEIAFPDDERSAVAEALREQADRSGLERYTTDRLNKESWGGLVEMVQLLHQAADLLA